jgi:molybdate transport system regulatory protein
MNKLSGNIVDIETSGNLSRVEVALSNGIKVSAVVIERPDTASYLKINNAIHVLFKETEVILSKDPEVAVSIANRIPGTISGLLVGDLFCEITMHTDAGDIKAIINKVAYEKWPLQTKDQVIAMVKTNEIMLQE